MTYEEAIERLKKRICQEGAHREDKTYHFCTDGCMYAEDECEVAIAIKAIEKQIPKKIANRNEIYVDGRIIVTLGRCPLCKCEVSDKHTFCYICGQHIDWSDEE